MLKIIKKINTNVIFSVLAVMAIICFSGNLGSGEFLDTKAAFGYGGNGGSGIMTELMIHNEQVAKINDEHIVTWTTTKEATSRVVYDTVSRFSLSALDMADSNYGYAHTTATFDEHPNMVVGHTVPISGLTANTTYYFRPISMASPEKYGKELSFTTGDIEEIDEVIVLGEEGAPDLTITKTVDVDFANPGDTAIYKVNIINNSNLTAFNAILTDDLPAGFTFTEDGTASKTWALGDIEPGQAKGAEYSAVISSSIEEGIYSNIAEVSADNHDPISASVDLEVRKVGVLGIELAPTGFSVKEFIILILAFAALTGSVAALRKKYLA